MAIPILTQQPTLVELARLYAISRGEVLPGGFLSPLERPSRASSAPPAGSVASSSNLTGRSSHTRPGWRQSKPPWTASKPASTS